MVSGECKTNLSLGEHERGGHLETLGSGQVLVHLELALQLQELLRGEGRPGTSGLAHGSGLSPT